MKEINMKKVIVLVVCMMMLNFQISQQRVERTRITKSRKILRNTKFPRSSDKPHRYYVKAPPNHIIILKFFIFKLSSNPTEFLKISDGRKGNEASKENFYGNKGKFKYVSKRNVLRILFHPDVQSRKTGIFWARVYFVNTTSHCNYTSLSTQTGVTAATCESKVDDFATQCTVQCENPEEQHEAQCSNGIFLYQPCTEHCDLGSFQVQNATLTSCNAINDRASQCQFSCDQHFVGNVSAVCQNGTVVANACLPNVTEINQCEESEMLDCPFSLREISQFYESGKSLQNGNLSKEMEKELNALPEPEIDLNTSALGRTRGKTYFLCPNYLCDKKWVRGRKRYWFRCGWLHKKRRGRLTVSMCMFCRYYVNCQRPVRGQPFN